VYVVAILNVIVLFGPRFHLTDFRNLQFIYIDVFSYTKSFSFFNKKS